MDAMDRADKLIDSLKLLRETFERNHYSGAVFEKLDGVELEMQLLKSAVRKLQRKALGGADTTTDNTG